MGRRVIIIIICIAALAAPSGGCGWPVHPREVDQLQLIRTLGFDSQAGGVVASASSGPEGGESLRLSARGESFTDAVEKLRHWAAREELFFSHVRFAVVGEAAARRGIGPVLDYFERGTQTPLDLPLLVVRGGTARELVTASEDPDYEITALLAALQRDAERTGAARSYTVLDTARQLSRSGAALCCAVEPRAAGENVPSAEKALCAVPAGYAVLKDGVLAGYLDPDAALGADLLLGRAGAACLVLPAGTGQITVELRGAGAELTPRYVPGRGLALEIVLHAEAGILQADGADPQDPETRRALDAALSEELLARAEAALRASRELRADFLELRLLTERKCGALPETLTGEALLSSLRWELRAEARSERSYDLEAPVPLTGEEAGA